MQTRITANRKTVIVTNSTITVNGKQHNNPHKGAAVSVVDDNVYVGKYKFKDGKFKVSLAAIWHNWL